MKKIILNEHETTLEDVFLILGNALSIYLYIVSGLNIGFIPIIAILSLKMLYNLILFFKRFRSCAIVVDNNKIILNHTLLLNNITISFSEIDTYDKRKKIIRIKPSKRAKLPLLYRLGYVGFHTLTNTECRELFNTLDIYFEKHTDK